MKRDRSRNRGQAILEFTLVGLLVAFVLFSTFEISRAMWIYITLANAAKEAARYGAMRGDYYYLACVKTADGVADPSLCTLDTKKVAQAISAAGPGLVPAEVINVHMVANGTQDLTCPGTDHSLQGCLGAATPDAFDVVNNLHEGATFNVRMQYKLNLTFATIRHVYTIPDLPASGMAIVQF